MAKQWMYSDTPGHQVGLMICTACRGKIESGEFRYRETEDAYLPQHRACSESDPEWPRLDKKRNDRLAFFARREAALQAFVNEFGAPDDDLIDECMAKRR